MKSKRISQFKFVFTSLDTTNYLKVYLSNQKMDIRKSLFQAVPLHDQKSKKMQNLPKMMEPNFENFRPLTKDKSDTFLPLFGQENSNLILTPEKRSQFYVSQNQFQVPSQNVMTPKKATPQNGLKKSKTYQDLGHNLFGSFNNISQSQQYNPQSQQINFQQIQNSINTNSNNSIDAQKSLLKAAKKQNNFLSLQYKNRQDSLQKSARKLDFSNLSNSNSYQKINKIIDSENSNSNSFNLGCASMKFGVNPNWKNQEQKLKQEFLSLMESFFKNFNAKNDKILKYFDNNVKFEILGEKIHSLKQTIFALSSNFQCFVLQGDWKSKVDFVHLKDSKNDQWILNYKGQMQDKQGQSRQFIISLMMSKKQDIYQNKQLYFQPSMFQNNKIEHTVIIKAAKMKLM